MKALRIGSDSSSTLMWGTALVVIACLMATAVWFGARDRTGDDTDGNYAASKAVTGTGNTKFGSTIPGRTESMQSVVEQVAPEAAPTDGVVIPAGTDQVNGYPTKFPPTDLGAVALQIEVAKAQVGFDYDQAVTVAGLYANPEDRAVFEERARAAVDLRRQQAGIARNAIAKHGISRNGGVPAPASYAVTPVAYTLQQLGADFYAVNLLSYVTLTTVAGEVKDGLYAGTQLMRWLEADGSWDWRLVEGSPEDIRHLLEEGQPQAVAPDTPGFQRAGWVRISGASR